MEQDYKIKVGITQGDRNVYPCGIWLFESGGLSS